MPETETPKPAATDTPKEAPDAVAVEDTWPEEVRSIEEGSLHDPAPKPDTPDEAPASDEDLLADENEDEAANEGPSTETDEETPSKTDDAETEPDKDAEPDKADADVEDSEAEPDTDVATFNPADHELDASYGQCKTVEEALKLAETRRASAEVYAKREATKARTATDDLAAVRSGAAAVKPDAEPDAAAAAAAAAAQVWTKEQRLEFHRTLDEQPEAVMDYMGRQISTSVLAEVDARIEAGIKAGLKTERSAETKRVADEAAKVDLAKLYEAHPDAQLLVEAGDFETMAATLGGRYHFQTLYDAVTLEKSDPETFKAILPDLQLGHTVEEARKRAADAGKAAKYDTLAKKNAARKADEARRHASPSSARTARSDAVSSDAIGIENIPDD